MKKLQFKATPVLIAAFALTCAVSNSSCNNTQNEKMDNAMDTVTTKMDNMASNVKQDIDDYRDENFVKDVIEANDKELHLLALGQQKGMDKELKMHAKMMEKDHKALGEKMRAYAAKQNYSLSPTDTKDGLDDDAAGADWDKKWADKMADDHQKTIDKFEKAESRNKDQELKDIVSATLPTLRSHLDMCKSLQDKLNK